MWSRARLRRGTPKTLAKSPPTPDLFVRLQGSRIDIAVGTKEIQVERLVESTVALHASDATARLPARGVERPTGESLPVRLNRNGIYGAARHVRIERIRGSLVGSTRAMRLRG